VKASDFPLDAKRVHSINYNAQAERTAAMMVTTRTPLRVSLFGGGTDYPAYFEEHPGAVIGLAIDKYIYISAVELTAWQDYNYRLAYSKLEMVKTIEEIEHPLVRAVLADREVKARLDINVISDLPASSGLGSSSAFSVGFVNLVTQMFGRPMAKMELARAAMDVEQRLLQENVGVQDQLHTAFGGINRFDFHGRRMSVSPVNMSGSAMEALDRCLVLVHTGRQRRATHVAADKIAGIKSGKSTSNLDALYKMVGECMDMLESAKGDAFVPHLGEMLDESWKIKRQLSDRVSDESIDELYARGMAAGAQGGKLCGAGGGGFILMVVDPDRIDAFTAEMAPNPVIRIGVDSQGSSLLHSPERPKGLFQRRPVAA
jgi:D-glycero-alpha-D-manno-heptose-7-phosphate kinase